MRKQKLFFLPLTLLLALSVLLIFSCDKGKLLEEKNEKQKEEIAQAEKDSTKSNTANKYPGPCPYPCDQPECIPYADYCGGGRGTPPPVVTYAGVNITLETSEEYGKILKFNSTADVNTVIDQLDSDYETYNQNYENQYPNLTPEQLDSIDDQNGFYEFQPYRVFENKFPNFVSKRSQIEITENTWLSNNLTGIDPDSVDFTFDESENVLFNNNYQLKIGNITYQMTADGLADVSSASVAAPMGATQLTVLQTKERRKNFLMVIENIN